MPFPMSYIILLSVFINGASLLVPRERFLYPMDGLSADEFRDYRIRDMNFRLVFYMKVGEEWQGVTDPDDVHWSGYRTVTGDTFRYAQARVYVRQVILKGEEGEQESPWSDSGLIDNIPTCVPGECLPDSEPVVELMVWSGEEPRVKPRYTAPMENFSPTHVVDTDPLMPGKEGEYGAVVIDAYGVKRLQRGIELSGVAGTTPVMAAALGRVVLVSHEGNPSVSVIDPGTGMVVSGVPPGRGDKGPTLTDYGNCVYVEHPDGYTVRYAHLGSISVKCGQGVLPGTVLGTVGSGKTDPLGQEHAWVHIEVREGDPLKDEGAEPLNPWKFFYPRTSVSEHSAP